MKYAYAAIFAAALARAQSLEDVPKCAIPCLDDAVKSETDCAVDDYACICPQFDAVQGAATGCVLDACGADVALNEVLPAVSALCENVGSPSDVPTTTEEPTQAPTEEPTEEPTEAPTEEPTEPAPTEPAPTEEPTEPAPEPTVAPTTAPAPPAPTNGTNTNPPEPVPTAAAAAFAPLGGLALAGLLGLAL